MPRSWTAYRPELWPASRHLPWPCSDSTVRRLSKAYKPQQVIKQLFRPTQREKNLVESSAALLDTPRQEASRDQAVRRGDKHSNPCKIRNQWLSGFPLQGLLAVQLWPQALTSGSLGVPLRWSMTHWSPASPERFNPHQQDQKRLANGVIFGLKGKKRASQSLRYLKDTMSSSVGR
eukprot:4693664-Amphidinium_carterae.1